MKRGRTMWELSSSGIVASTVIDIVGATIAASGSRFRPAEVIEKPEAGTAAA